MQDGSGFAANEGAVVINSVIGHATTLGTKAVVTHCRLQGLWQVGNDSFLSGIADAAEEARVEDSVAIFQRRIVAHDGTSNTVWTVFGVDDNLDARMGGGVPSTFCNEDWSVLFARTGICQSDLWFPETPQCLATARLFPVWILKGTGVSSKANLKDVLWLQPGGQVSATQLVQWRESWRVSLQTIMSMSDTLAEFAWRRELYFAVGDAHTRSSLMHPEKVAAGACDHSKPNQCLTPFFCKTAVSLELTAPPIASPPPLLFCVGPLNWAI